MRHEMFSTPTPIRVDVDLPAGRVHVEAVETHETEVELEPVGDNPASREAVERARVTFGDGDLSVSVSSTTLSNVIRGRRVEVAVRIRCPQGSTAVVKTRHADITGRGRFARASISTASGDVAWSEVGGDAQFNTVSGGLRVGPVSGRLELNTVSGDVTLERVGGPLQAHAVSGDLTFREAADSVEAETVSGDLEVGSVEAGRVVLGSVSGDVRVGIKRGSRLAVDATAVSGALESEIELAGVVPESGEEGPLVDLRARTISGDLRIVRA
jgi:DUF4097 and DUF4098 domain-containing protein YvlB